MNRASNSTITSTSRIDEHAARLVEVAQDFQAAAGKAHSSATAPAALRRLEEALQALSAGWCELAADAAPGIAERRLRHPTEGQPPRADRGRSHEQEALLMSALHDVAAGFARCARSCREGRASVAPMIIKARTPDQLTGSMGSPPLSEATGAQQLLEEGAAGRSRATRAPGPALAAPARRLRGPRVLGQGSPGGRGGLRSRAGVSAARHDLASP